MPLTLWILGLAALGAAVFGLRWQRERARHSSRADLARRKSAAEQAELDRRECRELEQTLRTGAYGDSSRPDASPPES